MYTDKNVKTKKALREAIAAGETVGVFNPGPFGDPQPPRWYARVTIENGAIVKVA